MGIILSPNLFLIVGQLQVATTTAPIRSSGRKRVRTRAQYKGTGKQQATGPPCRIKGMLRLLSEELTHVSHNTLLEYATSLVSKGYDSKRALQLCPISNFVEARAPKGHAIQIHDVWASSSNSSSGDSNGGSSSSAPSSDES